MGTSVSPCRQHRLDVVQRLPHAHEDDVGEVLASGARRLRRRRRLFAQPASRQPPRAHHLLHNLRRRQIPPQPRGLHSSTLQLNLSTFWVTGNAIRGWSGGV